MIDKEMDGDGKKRLKSLEDVYKYVKQQQFFVSQATTRKEELKGHSRIMYKLLEDLNILLYEDVEEEIEPLIKPLTLRQELRDLIKEYDDKGGIEFEEIKKEITYSPKQINEAIKKMLEDGEIYEPKIGKLRWLG